jgi:hypothetical protein
MRKRLACKRQPHRLLGVLRGLLQPYAVPQIAPLPDAPKCSPCGWPGCALRRAGSIPLKYVAIGYNCHILARCDEGAPSQETFQRSRGATTQTKSQLLCRPSPDPSEGQRHNFCAEINADSLQDCSWACNRGRDAHVPVSGSLIGSHLSELPDHFLVFGGVLDSTLGWSAPLPVESRGSLVKSPANKIIGNNEEMPLAA